MPARGVAVRARLRISLAAARQLRAAGDYPAAEECVRRAIGTAEADLGRDALELGVLLNELVLIGRHQGDFVAAARHCRRALAIHEQHGVRAGVDFAAILYNLARCEEELGEVAGATGHLRDAVAVLTGSVTDSDPLLTACRHRLRLIGDAS